MEDKKLSMEDLTVFCKKKGFVFQAAEIYGGLSGFFDFGPLGVELKNNVKRSFWKRFISKREDLFGQDGSIITNPKVWKASGHLDTFGDLILTTKETKTKLRADHFIEDELNIPADGMSPEEIMNLIKKHDLKYNGEGFTDVKMFRVMFETQVGADASKNATAYLRPETAQSIFPNFKLVAEVARAKLPFGIAQVGKSFRNEISPRDFVFRSREFEQMEVEYFYNSKSDFKLLTNKHLDLKVNILTAEAQDKDSDKMDSMTVAELLKKDKLNEVHGYWLAEFYFWLSEDLGISLDNLRIREHVETELSHYSTATFDIDYKYPFGFKEMGGFANRGSYDLEQHQKTSKQKLEFFDEENKEKLLPSVIEPSLGVERVLLGVLCEAYKDDKERGNIVLDFAPKMAPYKVAVLPLVNKGGLPEVARQIFDDLIEDDIEVYYDKSASVGRRYARQDELGTPYCLTIDYETIEDGDNKDTVTIRDRNSTEQKRIKLNEVNNIISNLIKGKVSFKDL